MSDTDKDTEPRAETAPRPADTFQDLILLDSAPELDSVLPLFYSRVAPYSADTMAIKEDWIEDGLDASWTTRDANKLLRCDIPHVETGEWFHDEYLSFSEWRMVAFVAATCQHLPEVDLMSIALDRGIEFEGPDYEALKVELQRYQPVKRRHAFMAISRDMIICFGCTIDLLPIIEPSKYWRLRTPVSVAGVTWRSVTDCLVRLSGWGTPRGEWTDATGSPVVYRPWPSGSTIDDQSLHVSGSAAQLAAKGDRDHGVSGRITGGQADIAALQLARFCDLQAKSFELVSDSNKFKPIAITWSQKGGEKVRVKPPAFSPRPDQWVGDLLIAIGWALDVQMALEAVYHMAADGLSVTAPTVPRMVEAEHMGKRPQSTSTQTALF